MKLNIPQLLRGQTYCVQVVMPLVHKVGPEAAFLLSCLLWKQFRPGEWFHISRDDIQKFTTLSHEKQLSRRKELVKHGFLEERFDSASNQMFYRVNNEALENFDTADYDAMIQEESKPDGGGSPQNTVTSPRNTATSPQNTAAAYSRKEPSKELPKEQRRPAVGLLLEQWVEHFPDPLKGNRDFLISWGEWLQHLKDKKKPLGVTAGKKQLEKLATLGAAQAIEAINRTIEKNWQGLWINEDTKGNDRRNVGTALETANQVDYYAVHEARRAAQQLTLDSQMAADADNPPEAD
jgi:hypothetical protein